ncbi:MAG: hypothetical protein HZA53_19185 [Planctomycetes bacterium]|nr:hypothetical protein [Planctomycetota bacterium]
MRTSRFFVASIGMAFSIALCVSTSAVGGRADTLNVRAWIDGRSQLTLQGDTAQWSQFDFAAPGRLDCDTGSPIQPTYLGVAAWLPNWPDASTCENRFCNCSSDVFTGLVPSLPSASFTAVLHLVQVRNQCTIVEFPTAANGYRVVIEFDDNPWGGADWYEVVLEFHTSAPGLVVGAQGDPFLAGQPDGATSHSDTAPAQSPLLVPLIVSPCETVRFTNVTGSVSYGPANPFYGPDGGFSQASSADLGIAGYTMPVCCLLGVFLTDTTNSGPPPTALDFSTPASQDFVSLAPALHQTFFIGDGLRADGVTVQTFRVPPGATRLFLGVCDGYGWFNNVGSFQCTFEQIPCTAPIPCGQWSLAADFRVAPDQENPNRDACGNLGVWHFLGSDPATFPAHDPSMYTLLSDYFTDMFTVPGLETWQGTHVQAPSYPNLPSVAINNTGAHQSIIGIEWPAGVVNVHPLSDQLVIVGWRSPYTGRVSIIGGVQDLDNTCASSPDGIAWSIDRYDGVTNTTLASGAIPDGGAQDFRAGVGGASLVSLAVAEGDFLYFIVDPMSEFACDSTGLDIVIRPAESGAPFCFGDGLDTTHSSPCPCANFGAPGHGCGNSMNPDGGLLEANGTIGFDDVALTATGMPLSVACIFLQGDGLADSILNDGVRCVGGQLIRLRVRQNVFGTSSFPDAADTWTLSYRGGVTVGSGETRYYQAYYRNAAVTFCPSGVSNLTNGWTIVW